ncbi:hypothetical protein T484DRAFT_2264985 [Baffinella frigidus]|nr:hypothetical protein T484DRAFT_2264985 [Cryptophyta sp. CCMP2293]
MGTAVPLSLLMLNLASCTALRGPAFAAPALGDTFSWDFLNRAPDRAAASKLLPQERIGRVYSASLPLDLPRPLRPLASLLASMPIAGASHCGASQRNLTVLCSGAPHNHAWYITSVSGEIDKDMCQ